MNSALTHPPADYINGSFVSIEGNTLVSHNPAAPDDIMWTGSPESSHIDPAIQSARIALDAWANASLDDRIAVLRRWQDVTTKHVDRIAGLITDEMGKTIAESRFEAKALGAKVDITLNERVIGRVSDYSVSVHETRDGHCRFKPHGVMAVIGPFNFPAHLPNGHFVPAMLLGNTIVFKPSEKTPAVGQLLAELMDEAGVPRGVFNLVQGGGEIASTLVNHNDIDGVLFTGSWPVGRRILEANLDRPGRMIALEMGGNNPAIVLDDAALKQAVVECVRASFATTGQRCTCTRRIIVQSGVAGAFISAFCKMTSTLLIGHGRDEPAVFMGPVISSQAAQSVLEVQDSLATAGAEIIMPATLPDQVGYFVTPSVVRVNRFTRESDQEVFGPLVQISIVDDIDDAIEQANATQFGLAASVFTSSTESYEHTFRQLHAGCINRNTGTAGASSMLPFGGLGRSGNNRPAGAFSVDYCAYPIANMIEHSHDAAIPAGTMWDDQWIGSSASVS